MDRNFQYSYEIFRGLYEGMMIPVSIVLEPFRNYFENRHLRKDPNYGIEIEANKRLS